MRQIPRVRLHSRIHRLITSRFPGLHKLTPVVVRHKRADTQALPHHSARRSIPVCQAWHRVLLRSASSLGKASGDNSADRALERFSLLLLHLNGLNGATRLNVWNVWNRLQRWCVMCQTWPGRKWRLARGIVFLRGRFFGLKSQL